MLVTMTRDCSVTYTKLVCYLQDNLVCHGDGKQACVASESTILCARECGFQNALLKHPLQTISFLQAHFTFVLGDDDKGSWCCLQHKLLCQLLEKQACVASDSTIICVRERYLISNIIFK
jgi:hypothetical protein